MLATLGILMVLTILVLLVTNKASPVVGFVLVPLIVALVAGFGLGEIGGFMGAGLRSVVSITTMIVFAILFFSILLEAGTFDPIVDRFLGFAGENPVTIALVTAALTTVVAFDGDGSSTFLIVITALLPFYRRLRMSPLVLTTIVGLAAGVQNIVPWGGPTARAGAAIGVDPNELWVPMIPVQIVGLLASFGVAYYLGLRERTRLAGLVESASEKATGSAQEEPDTRPLPSREIQEDNEEDLTRPRLFWINLVLMLLTIVALITAILPPEFVFMIGFVIVLLVNYPNPRLQIELIQKHSRAPVLIATILLSSGVFLGIARESGMFDAVTTVVANAIPAGLAPLLPLVVGALSVPMSILIEVNAYYLGMLPILTGVTEQAGIAPEAMAKASLIGMYTVGFPLTPLTPAFFLLVGLAEVNIGAHIRHMLPWAWLVGIVMLIAAIALGQIPFVSL
jgi:citrate-Mg2+:H+ or citrate-Ca2+:H+ symporter, CitMHS family